MRQGLDRAHWAGIGWRSAFGDGEETFHGEARAAAEQAPSTLGRGPRSGGLMEAETVRIKNQGF